VQTEAPQLEDGLMVETIVSAKASCVIKLNLYSLDHLMNFMVKREMLVILTFISIFGVLPVAGYEISLWNEFQSQTTGIVFVSLYWI